MNGGTWVRTIFLVITIFIFVFLTYYLVDQYRQYELSKVMEDFQFVTPERLNHLSIVQYPEERIYTSFHYDEVQEILHTFNKLELEKKKRLLTSENNTKIRLIEDGSYQFIEYYLYDNGFINYVEDGSVGYRNITYKMEEEELEELLTSLLTGKTLE